MPVRTEAADDATCQEFASAMIALVKVNSTKHCTGMGPAWSPRPTEHIAWCLKATPAAVKDRLAQSKSFIDTCLKTGIGSNSAEAPAASPAASKLPPSVAPAAAAKPNQAAARDQAVESALPARTFP